MRWPMGKADPIRRLYSCALHRALALGAMALCCAGALAAGLLVSATRERGVSAASLLLTSSVTPWRPSLASRRGSSVQGAGRAASSDWSGYVVYGARFTDVKGSWVQPRASCASAPAGSNAVAGFWLGLDGYRSPTVEQVGTEADCEGHKPVYLAWSELYPHRLAPLSMGAHPVRPGDVMRAQVTQRSLRLEDSTQGWTAVVPVPASRFQYSSAEWVAEAPSQRLADFGKVAFASASVSDSEASEQPIDSGIWPMRKLSVLSSSAGRMTVRALASGLVDQPAGSSFAVDWLHH